MLTGADSVQLNLVLDNPTSSFIRINILHEEEVTTMPNKSDQEAEIHQAVKARLEKKLSQKEHKEKLDLLIYQYKDTIFVRLNGKWVQFD